MTRRRGMEILLKRRNYLPGVSVTIIGAASDILILSRFKFRYERTKKSEVVVKKEE